MSELLSLTAGDLIVALRSLLQRPAVDRALAERASAIATAVSAEGIAAHVVRDASGAYEVVASAPGLFAREFGSVESPPQPVLGPIIDGVARRIP